MDYGADLPRVRGSFQRLEQVILNLIQNACHALPDRQKGIFVTTACDREGSNVLIVIRDEGSRHSPRGPAPHPGAVLHHQAGLRRHRPGPFHLFQDRRRAPGQPALCFSAGRRHHGDDHASGRYRHNVVRGRTPMSQDTPPQRPILLVDDEAQALTSFEMTLRSAGMSHFISCHDSRDVTARARTCRRSRSCCWTCGCPTSRGRSCCRRSRPTIPMCPSSSSRGRTMWRPPSGACGRGPSTTSSSPSRRVGWSAASDGPSSCASCTAKTSCSRRACCRTG